MVDREKVAPNHMAVVLSDRRGTQLHRWLPSQYQTVEWTREGSKASKCELVVPRKPGLTVASWHHWVSVWDIISRQMLWRGPVVHRARGRDRWSISARDVGVLAHKTRSPVTNRWDGQYPATIAAELWAAMLDLHGLDIIPTVLDDPLGDPFDFETTRDDKMLNLVMDELVKLGLQWTVVAGTPVLGPMPLEPVAALAEDHFLDHDLELIEDGTSTCNDVVLRGPDTIGRDRVPLPDGLVLQGLANVDDMFGVTNVNKAVRQFLRYHSAPHEYLAGGEVKLSPRAPITLAQCVPSTRVTVNVYETRHKMEIESLKVFADKDGSTASIGLGSVNDDPPELDANVEPSSL